MLGERRDRKPGGKDRESEMKRKEKGSDWKKNGANRTNKEDR